MDEKIRIFQEMKKHGVSVDRVDFVGARQSQEEHLDFYNKIDIALDTFPYNGTTTTCEALWMGVPVLTRAGSTHTSRVSGSILSSIGAGELIAGGWKDFVVKARDLATSIDRMRLYRHTLRDRMASSEICDADGMVSHLGQFFQAVLGRK
ncbi:MAG: hypothetical protein Q27BPR15_17475 [Rhodobacter sp. CACIA14H1]|nr:MAG: hypothetical protein Q27BPR15_17475 [Rhodobacter sp. CACIA14H1]